MPVNVDLHRIVLVAAEKTGRNPGVRQQPHFSPYCPSCLTFQANVLGTSRTRMLQNAQKLVTSVNRQPGLKEAI